MATTRRLRAVLEGQDRGATALLTKAKGAIGALGAVAATVGGTILAKKLVSGIVEATKAAGVQEAAELKLAKAIQITGESAVQSLPDLRAYASSLQDLTGVGDEAILSSQALLVSIGKLSGDTLKQATLASLDLAAAIGVDQRTAFDLVSKAASGYTGTLSRYGIIIDQSLPESEKFAEVLATINKQFGGQAAAQLKTFEGRLAEFQGRIGDLKEAVGGPFKEAFKVVLGEALSPFIKDLTEGVGQSETFRRAVLTTAAGIARFGGAIIRVTEPLRNFIAIGAALEFTKFNTNIALGTKFLNAMVPATEGNTNALDALADSLEKLASEPAKKVEDTLEDIATGTETLATASETLRENLKSLGVTFEQDLTAKAKLLNDTYLALSDPAAREFLTPEQYEIVNQQLRAMAEAIVAEGGVLPNWQLVTSEVIGLGEAIGIVAEQGVGGLVEALRDAGADLEKLGTTIKRNLRGVAISAALEFGDTLVNAAFEGELAFGEFFRQLLKDLARAIIQALILKAILGALGFGEGGQVPTSVPFGGFLSQGGRIPLRGQSGFFVPGADIGRDRVPAILRPGELVLPRELSDFILARAGGEGGGGAVEVEIKSDIPMLVERVNRGVRQGTVRTIASQLSTTRQVR